MRGEGPRSANPLQIEAKVNTMAALYCCRRRAARPEGVASVVGGDERHTLAGTPTCCSSHPTMHEIIVTLSHRRFALWQPPSPSACHASGPWASVIKCAEEGPRSKFEACLLHPHQRQAPPWPLIRRHLLVVLSSPWFAWLLLATLTTCTFSLDYTIPVYHITRRCLDELQCVVEPKRLVLLFVSCAFSWILQVVRVLNHYRSNGEAVEVCFIHQRLQLHVSLLNDPA
jgi:hypothetical protein